MSRVPAGSALATSIALLSGLVFGASLVYFVFAYMAQFVAVAEPWTTETGLRPALVNIGLFSAFALHHSVLARSGIKARVTSVLPPHLERSSYVLVASVLFLAICWWWQPMAGVLWTADAPWNATLVAAQIAGGVLTLRAAGRIDMLDLAGVRQAMGRSSTRRVPLVDDGLYGFVRHPVYLGWLLIVWPVPTMTATRLTFAALSTLYLVVAIPLEERSLADTFGQEFAGYRKRVRWRMVPFVY